MQVFHTQWARAVTAVVFALALAVPAAAQPASDTDSFTVEVTNPYVAWDGGFSEDPIEVVVAPGMARQYTTIQNFVVMSTTTFDITVAAAWQNDSNIVMNPNNNAVTNDGSTEEAFDIQISSRDDTNTWGSPSAGSQSLENQPNTLANNQNDDATYAAAITLVLVDEPTSLPGNHNSSGWDPDGGVDNRRFIELPSDSYTVDVTVTISES